MKATAARLDKRKRPDGQKTLGRSHGRAVSLCGEVAGLADDVGDVETGRLARDLEQALRAGEESRVEELKGGLRERLRKFEGG